MKRLHVHVTVRDIEESVKFYSTLFAAEPTVAKEDYAKWMLDDPRVNFAISTRGASPGINHLGIQLDDEKALSDVAGRLKQAGRPILEQHEANCCYARGDKAWLTDPQGVRWEMFTTFADITVYGEDTAEEIPGSEAEPAEPAEKPSACCEG